MNEKFGCKSVNENADSVEQVVSAGTSGVITDDSETLWFDNLESEVLRGARGAPDTGGTSKNGSNK
jgi:hypothetical protein